MFKALRALAQSAPIMICLSPEGEQLRVAIQQKETTKGAPLALSVVGTPEELDAELAGAIAAATNESPAPQGVAEQVRAQVQQDGAPKKTDTPAAANATPTKAAKKKRTTTEAPASTKTEKTGKPPAHTREACLEDLAVLVKQHGIDTVNREFFIKNGTTARSFERHFGGWKGFMEAAGYASSTDKPEADANGSAGVVDDKTLPLPIDSAGSGGESGTAAAGVTTEESPQAAPWEVCLLDGTLLFNGVPTKTLEVGGDLEHEGHTYLVDSLAAEDHAVWVRRKLRDIVLEDGTVIGKDQRNVETGDPVTVHDVQHEVLRADSLQIVVKAPPPPPKVRNVIDDDGAKVGTWTEDVTLIEEGSTIKLGDAEFTVMAFNEKTIFVERVAATEAA